MKKTAVLGMVTVILAGALSGSVWADPSLNQVKEVSDMDWIDGSSLFKASDSEGYYVADIDGNALSKSGYSSSIHCDDGYLTVYNSTGEVNCGGLLSLYGVEMIECKYGDIKVLNPNWAAAFILTPADANNYDYEALFAGDDDDKYFLIESVDFYHLADGKATLAGSFPRENCQDYNAEEDYLFVQDRSSGKVTLYDGEFNVVAEDLGSVYTAPEGIMIEDYEIYSDNGQQGVKDRNGNVVLEPAYKYVYDIRDGYVKVSTGDFYGLVDLTGKVIIPAEADEIVLTYYTPETGDGTPFVSAGYAAAYIGGKLAFYDLDGNQTVAPTLVKDLVEVNGASATYSDLEGNVHILAADGVDTVLDEAHKNIRPLQSGSGMLYSFEDENYKKGLIDWHGNELLPVGQYSLELSGDGQYLLAGTDYSSGVLYEVNYGTDSEAPADAA